MPKGLISILLLVVSNVFMTFAWYGNLKLEQMNVTKDWPLILIILLSWGIALLEYLVMIPAKRLGSPVTGGDRLHSHRRHSLQRRADTLEPHRQLCLHHPGCLFCLYENRMIFNANCHELTIN